MSDNPTPVTQQAAAGPLMLALTEQAQQDAHEIGVLWARLVRRGYRERANRAVQVGTDQGRRDAAGEPVGERRMF